MSYLVSFQKHILKFRFEAGTSRGVLTEKPTYFVRIASVLNPTVEGIGECSPLTKLSIDDRADYEEKLAHYCHLVANISGIDELYNLSDIQEFPSMVMGFETAFLDLQNGGKKMIFDNDFFTHSRPLPINGLIWMGDKSFMLRQIEEKLAQGFDCIKIKVGAIDFETECELLAHIRKRFSPQTITLRVDANGAFTAEEARKKIDILSTYKLHSIEQPIRKGQIEAMYALCRDTNVPIALDEELIGVPLREKAQILTAIKPQYIVLKPSLLGGFRATAEWIALAKVHQIGWWITSALESNIGLNAICQFTAQYGFDLPPQGLGTGQLYHNNIDLPLVVEKSAIRWLI
jgi:o-succinylbenzoate synthase